MQKIFRFSTSTRSVLLRSVSSNFSSSAGGAWSGPSSSRPSVQALSKKVDQFRFDVEKILPADGKDVVFGSAWIATDNVIVHLLHEHFPSVLQGMNLVGVDTLHLFDETHEVAKRVQSRYAKQAHIFKPFGLETRQQFEDKFGGDCESLNHADFDKYSKVEPFARALKTLNKDILVTGRRMDQGEKRITLNVWEPESRNFNPLATWSWAEVLAFTDYYDVPVNKAHNYVFRSKREIPAEQRHLPASVLGWEKVDLGKPFWRATEKELAGGSPVYYVFQSFGDVHTSVPVGLRESERKGRFVRYANTECGIHTRVAVKGSAHGGRLVNLMVGKDEQQELLNAAEGRVLELTDRQACDVEMLVAGGFSPLIGFMNEDVYDSVVNHMRLPEQQLFGLPITLDTNREDLQPGQIVILKYKGNEIGALEIESRWKPNKKRDAEKLYTTSSEEHPTVDELLNHTGQYYLGGRVHGFSLPFNESIPRFKTPAQVRAELVKLNKKNVIAFQCRNVIHRAHYELLVRAAKQVDNSVVLVHPTVGPTQPDDLDPMARIPAYEALEKNIANQSQQQCFTWSYLPYSMKMAGPREAIQHMIIRKNFGATHFIVGRDMAGTKDRQGKDFHQPYDAQEMALQHADELGMEVLTFENMVFTGEQYMEESEARNKGLEIKKLSGTEFRRLLRSGERIPSWFSFDAVVNALRNAGDGVRI